MFVLLICEKGRVETFSFKSVLMMLSSGVFSNSGDLYSLKAAMKSDHDVVCGEAGI
jgi:hypothetical protein